MQATNNSHCQKKRFQKAAALAAFIIPPLMWAGNFIVGRELRNDISPVMLTFCRWSVALIFILPFSLPFIKRDWPLYRQYFWRIIFVSLSGIAAFSLLVYQGLRSTSGTNALLLNSCVPLLIVLILLITGQTTINKKQVSGMLVSCCGILLIISGGHLEELMKMEFSSGDLMILGAMLSFSFYTVWLRGLPQKINRVGLLGIQIIVALVFVSPFLALGQGFVSQPEWNVKNLGSVLFLGIGPSFIAYFFYGYCVALIGAARASLSIHFTSVFGVVLSFIFLGENLYLYHLAGFIFILCGLSVIAKAR